MRRNTYQDIQLSVKEGYQLHEDEDLLKKIEFKSYCLIEYPGVRVKLEYVFDTTLQTVELYYVCNGNYHQILFNR